jgi:hypothetical protein
MSKTLTEVGDHAVRQELLALNDYIVALKAKLEAAQKRRDALKAGEA